MAFIPEAVEKHNMSDALRRASAVRGLAHALSEQRSDVQLWSRCCALIAELTEARRVGFAVRDDGTDRLQSSYDAHGTTGAISLAPGSPLSRALATGSTVIERNERIVAMPIRFGDTLLGAISIDGAPDYDAELMLLLESCALSIGTRLFQEQSSRNHERIERLALTDALTGIANRRMFNETVDREWARATRERLSIALLMVDIDFFKTFNDAYGHQAGDLCLRQVAEAFAGTLKRHGDVVARYGGEEFAVLLPGTDVGGAISLAESLRESVAALALMHGGSSIGRVTVSIGVAAVVPEADQRFEELIEHADHSLYRAKMRGRNRVVTTAYESDAEPARRITAAGPSNLPVQLNRLVGRHAELRDLQALFAQTRLLTITGPGGTGKTRIAVQLANDAASRFPDGAFFVDLARVEDSALVAHALASAIGAGGIAELEDGAVELLREKRALLVFDNCEHVIEGAAKAVAQLLRVCPDVSIIATSREPLSTAGETLYRLPLLGPNDAMELFVERARAVQPTFAVTLQNAETVSAICRELDGIALAIELAAPRIAIMSLEQLLARLHARLSILTGGDRTAPIRQQTIRAAIDWSYELLTTSERRVFARLAIFRGSFSFDAAIDVCGFDDTGEPVFDTVASLIRKSLIADDFGSSENRYRLLESTHEFADEELERSGERDAIARRHAEYYLSLARRADAVYRKTRSSDWIAHLEPDLENFRSALRWSLDVARDPVLGGALAGATVQFFHHAARSEADHWVASALKLLTPDEHPEIEARLYLAIGANARSGTAPQMRAAGERAVELYKRIGDEAGLAEGYRALAQTIAWYFPEERTTGEEVAFESVEIARRLNDPVQLAFSLRTLGLTRDNADVERKRADFAESIALLKQHAADAQISSTITWLSDFEFYVGDERRAYELGREAVHYAELAGSNDLLLLALTNFAFYAAALDEWNVAKSAATRSLELVTGTRQLANLTWAVQAMATFYAGVGDYQRASRLIAFCDARCGVVHAPRQADACEDVMHQRLMAILRERLHPEALATNAHIGSRYTEAQALAEIC